MATITINGEKKEVNAGSLAELTAELKMGASYLAVAINDKVIPRSEHAKTVVKEGDRIEIIHAVGGG